VVTCTVLADGVTAGNVVSFDQCGEREVGYWLGREYWGLGVATRALAAFLRIETQRPLTAHVARHNTASRRVLEKWGFTVRGEAVASVGPPDCGDDRSSGVGGPDTAGAAVSPRIEELILRLD
jgi:Acetyltransferase (GNAT) domain